jgi:hypothetical protein
VTVKDLVDKLTKALDEEERIALAANHEGRWMTHGDDGPDEGALYVLAGDEPDDGWRIATFQMYPRGIANSPSEPHYLPRFSTMPIRHIENAIHAAFQDPVRTLRRVAAHRKILEIHKRHRNPYNPKESACQECDEHRHETWFSEDQGCPTVLALAEEYDLTDDSGTPPTKNVAHDGWPYG